ncbi:MAG: hypothetical protein RLZZ627_1519 [Pseudomonadota bacterium]
MKRFFYLLLVLGLSIDLGSAGSNDSLSPSELKEIRSKNKIIGRLAADLVGELMVTLKAKHGPIERATSEEGQKAIEERNLRIEGLVSQRYQEVKEDFFKGRFDRSRARLPENIERWRSSPDISNPGADLANFPNSAFTLPQGRAYIETSPVTWYGGAYLTAPQYNAEYLLRYGLTDNVELRLFGNGASWQGGRLGGAGFSPLAFDTKIHLMEEREDLFLPAAGFEAYIQTELLASSGFSQGTNAGFSLNFDQSLPFDIDAEYNFGSNQVRKFNGDPYWQFNFQWALQKDVLNKDVAVFIHGFYNATSLPRLPTGLAVSLDAPLLLDAKPPQIAAVGGGALWTINRRVVVWGQASGGVTQYSPSVITNFGFAVAF